MSKNNDLRTQGFLIKRKFVNDSVFLAIFFSIR